MGVSVKSFRDDFTRFEVELRAKWYNRNLFGTHFGGSLYSMSDPFFVFIITMNFGSGYIVWDKSATIDFLKPAKGTILGIFEISKDRLEQIRAEVDELGKNTYHFEVTSRDLRSSCVPGGTTGIYLAHISAVASTLCPIHFLCLLSQ